MAPAAKEPGLDYVMAELCYTVPQTEPLKLVFDSEENKLIVKQHVIDTRKSLALHVGDPRGSNVECQGLQAAASFATSI